MGTEDGERGMGTGNGDGDWGRGMGTGAGSLLSVDRCLLSLKNTEVFFNTID